MCTKIDAERKTFCVLNLTRGKKTFLCTNIDTRRKFFCVLQTGWGSLEVLVICVVNSSLRELFFCVVNSSLGETFFCVLNSGRGEDFFCVLNSSRGCSDRGLCTKLWVRLAARERLHYIIMGKMDGPPLASSTSDAAG